MILIELDIDFKEYREYIKSAEYHLKKTKEKVSTKNRQPNC